MRGESLEPAGCSDTPTSGRAALTIAWPTDVAGRLTTALVAVVELAPSVAPVLAFSNLVAKLVGGVVATEVGVGAETAAGDSISCSSAMRARARSRDIRGLLRLLRPMALAQIRCCACLALRPTRGRSFYWCPAGGIRSTGCRY